MADQPFGVPEHTPADAEGPDTDHGDLQEQDRGLLPGA